MLYHCSTGVYPKIQDLPKFDHGCNCEGICLLRINVSTEFVNEFQSWCSGSAYLLMVLLKLWAIMIFIIVPKISKGFPNLSAVHHKKICCSCFIKYITKNTFVQSWTLAQNFVTFSLRCATLLRWHFGLWFTFRLRACKYFGINTQSGKKFEQKFLEEKERFLIFFFYIYYNLQ